MLTASVSRTRYCLVIVAALFSFCKVQGQITTAAKAASILHRMYVATGGANWRRLPGAEIAGSYDMGGLRGTFHQTIDFKNGRDVLTYNVGLTRGQQGTERGGSWWADDKGLVTVQQAPEALADAATQSFEDRNGWFEPASVIHPVYLGATHENGRSFYRIQVRPPAGRPLTLWIDSQNYRLDRIVWFDAHHRKNTTRFSDFHRVDGIWYPFVQRGSTGDTSSDVTVTISTFRVRLGLTDSDFAPPASKIHDARLLTASPSVVPFAMKDGMIIVGVSINGRQPVPFVLDSGAFNVLTPEAAKKLDLQMEGNLAANGMGNKQVGAQLTRVDSYRAGLAELTDQRFVVIPLPRSLTDNGNQPPIAGLIGYEFLRRFVVRIDYHRRQLTIASPGSAQALEQGTRVPLLFDGRDCFIRALVDGEAGYFGVDTGDDGALTVFGPFFSVHHFPIETPGIQEYHGGVGGSPRTLLTRVNSLQIGPFQLKRPLTEIQIVSAGAFASSRIAGNLGSQIFRNFILTFDYGHRYLYLKPSPDFGYAMPYNRTGIHLDVDQAGNIIVTSVNESSPGAVAGVEAHDEVVAIDRQSVRGRPFADVEAILSRPAGSPLTIEVLRHGKLIRLEIIPKNLLPFRGQLHSIAESDVTGYPRGI